MTLSFEVLYNMETITIKTNNANALKLLEDLEACNLIQVIKRTVVKGKRKKLSERLAGSLTSEHSIVIRKELTEMRNEWDRNI